jgi:DNA-binding CsgD family transcriptional regulator
MKITKREKIILSLLVEGHSNQIIGDTLDISKWTVVEHLRHLRDKTGADNRINLVVWSIKNKVVEI